MRHTGSSPSESSGCGDLNWTAAYLERRLDRAERRRYEEHAQRCGPCGDLLAACLQDLAAQAEAKAPEESRGWRPAPWMAAVTSAAVLVLALMIWPRPEEPEVVRRSGSGVAEQVVADRTFRYEPEHQRWVDTEIDAVAALGVLPLERGSVDRDELAAEHPEIERWAELGDVVRVLIDGQAYELREPPSP